MLDGGSLLYKLKWKQGDTYGNIATAYADFTTKHYGAATVVFDGYCSGPSIKDNTHQRRGHANSCPTVNITRETKFHGKRDEFLSIGSNKQQLITLIGDKLKEVGCTVIQADGDADVDIAKTAVNSTDMYSTTLIGEDTDLLLLLLHYCKADGKALYFRSDNQSRTNLKVYNINRMKQVLGNKLCTHLLFLHSFTGCDSTSRVYGIGKKSIFQKVVKNDPVLGLCADTFTSRGVTPTQIENLGCQAMTVVFGGESTCSLSALRYIENSMFSKKVAAAKSFVTPERLPPTKSATTFHCFRVYYQILVWMGFESDLDPLDWGWRLEDGRMVPIMTAMDAAPDNLLKMVHCNCITGCSTARCSCRKSGLACSSVCGSCQVTSCDNPLNQILDELDDSDED